MGAKHKISGFTTALILAIVSFFVIYFFCPNFAEKSLGTSFKSTGSSVVKKTDEKNKELNKDEIKKSLQDAKTEVKNLTDKLSDTKEGLSHLFGK